MLTSRSCGSTAVEVQTSLLAFMIFTLRLPFSIVEHTAFRGFVASLQPRYALPTRKTLAGPLLNEVRAGQCSDCSDCALHARPAWARRMHAPHARPPWAPLSGAHGCHKVFTAALLQAYTDMEARVKEGIDNVDWISVVMDGWSRVRGSAHVVAANAAWYGMAVFLHAQEVRPGLLAQHCIGRQPMCSTCTLQWPAGQLAAHSAPVAQVAGHLPPPCPPPPPPRRAPVRR